MKISLTFDSLPEVDQFAKDWLLSKGQAIMAPVPAQRVEPKVTPAPMPALDPPAPAAPVPPVTAGPAVQTPMPAPQPAPAPVPMPAPQPAQAPVTIEDVTRAAVALADQGRKNDLIALLDKFRVHAITELGPDQLGPFKQALDILGGLA